MSIRALSFATLVLSSIAAAACSSPNANDRDPNGGTGGRGSGGGKGNAGSGVVVPPTVILPSCGDGKLNAGEECDDGNSMSGDGCNGACRIEADWACPTPGSPCVGTAACGDGMLARSETCDDGNTMPGDGCAANCGMVEPGWQCRVAGRACVPLCGDGVLTGAENCDDKNAVGMDGCSSTCLTEPGYTCATVGAPCTKSECGNKIVEAGETCDAGDKNGLFFGDASGCSKTCTKEPTCRNAMGMTTACSTPCGDGNVDKGEQCDDGNGVDGDGCSKTCTPEEGFTCAPISQPDTTTCTGSGSKCLVLPITYRDFEGQQNTAGGHPDFFFLSSSNNCVPNASAGKSTPLVGNCANTDATELCQTLVTPTLGPDGKPVYNTAKGGTCACRFTDWDQTGILTAGTAGVTNCVVTGDGSSRLRIEKTAQVIKSADSFKQWYSDSPLGTKVVGTLELAQVDASNQYRFSSSNGRTVYDDIHDIFLGLPTSGGTAPPGAVTSLTSGFFPLEMEPKSKLCNLWPYWRPSLATSCVAATGTPVASQWDPRGWYGNQPTPPNPPTGGPVAPVTGVARNFYFTSEVRYLFRYAGGEILQFFGDDDVWVYINGRLVLDLGAPHERLQGRVTLTPTGADWVIESQNLVTQAFATIATGSVPNLGLEVGSTYEIAVFHADRHPRESNYQLTISGFSTTQSSCAPRCGDAKVTTGEECDDGDDKNQDGVYGGCTKACKFGPFCGDNEVNGMEECDLGRGNTSPLHGSKEGCTPGCTTPGYCGDGLIDSAFGEECDDGPNNDVGLCTSQCTLKAR